MPQIIQGHALEVLKGMEAESVNCCVTSPPYWGLRDYGLEPLVWDTGGEAQYVWDRYLGGCEHEWGDEKTKIYQQQQATYSGQCGPKATQPERKRTMVNSKISEYMTISQGQFCLHCNAWRGSLGLEPTIDLYVKHIVDIFREVRRVLRKDGTCWVNIGDSYAGNTQPGPAQSDKTTMTGGRKSFNVPGKGLSNLKPKDLCLIPYRVALALQEPYYTGKIQKVEDRIWLAAMIDGEGCMFIHKRKAGQSNGQGYVRKQDSFGAGLEVANSHSSIIEKCQKITGLGSICCVERENKHKVRNLPLYRWNVRSNQCREIIKEVYPYLVGKQHEARLVLGCPSSGPDAEKAHLSVIALHNGKEPCIDFKPPESMYEPGWYVRSDCIWSKKNPMPESCRDRPTKSHEYVYLLATSGKYYFDQDAVREKVDTQLVKMPHGWATYKGGHGSIHREGREKGKPNNAEIQGRNIRTVWNIATQPYPEAHFATFPETLAERCILAGCPEGGTVLDPFAGSGTVGEVCNRLMRHSILIELNPEYIKLIEKRCRQNNLFLSQSRGEK